MNPFSLEDRMLRGSLMTIFRLMKFSEMRMLLSRSSLGLRGIEEAQSAGDIWKDVKEPLGNEKDTRLK